MSGAVVYNMQESFTFIVLQIHCHNFQKCVRHLKIDYWSWGGGGVLYILQVGQDLETYFTSFISSLLLDHGGPALVMSWSNFSLLG